MIGYHDIDGHGVPDYVIEQAQPVRGDWAAETTEELDGALQAAMALLPPKQRYVLEQRFSYGDERRGERSQQEVADALNVSQQAVARLEARALSALRRILGA